MYYHVCFLNCYEDFHSEDRSSIKFNTLEDAQNYIHTLKNIDKCVFDVRGDLRWYFPSCDVAGILQSPREDDICECYLILNIIPSESEVEYINGSFSDDDRAIQSKRIYYTIDYMGNVSAQT